MPDFQLMRKYVRFFRRFIMVNRLRSFGSWLGTKERCPHKLALSFSVGAYIAFSPLIGLHTAMAFLFGWLFALNTAVLLSVSIAINNPWTMVLVYGSNHIVGNWLFQLLNIDGMSWNPGWLTSCNLFLYKYLGTGISFWAFFIGGNLLGLCIGGMIYPIVKRLFISHFLGQAGSR